MCARSSAWLPTASSDTCSRSCPAPSEVRLGGQGDQTKAATIRCGHRAARGDHGQGRFPGGSGFEVKDQLLEDPLAWKVQGGLIHVCESTLRWAFTASVVKVPVTSASPSGKFEDREDHVPKLEQINSTRILSSQNFSLTKKELLSTELLLLEAFSWNLCLPTPAHFLDYYLLASVSQKDHHCHSWPTTCPRKTKECLKEYAHYFLEVTLQDHIFYKFQPSVVAAACVGASRICLQLSPYWTRDLQRISNYSLEHLSTCIEILLVAYDNILKDAVAVKSQALAMVPGTPPAPTQVLFQPPAYPGLGQPTAMALAQFQTPVQDLCVAYRDSLQAHHSGTLLSGGSGSSLHALYPTLQPLDVCPVPLPTSLSMHMAIAAEPRHCLAATYGSSYFSGSHAFPAGCFDR
ncbi:hypothetical protein J1605_012214 [Eschrichtius robustus]|uniref:Cyclin-J-like protein n=1 Tax=Eschrichtius robustus TaxID=9764 RepID=A0AB34GKQ7_ESCRO|nr:hypothetical protein J1605_012214 [Eschrichtius robustus]